MKRLNLITFWGLILLLFTSCNTERIESDMDILQNDYSEYLSLPNDIEEYSIFNEDIKNILFQAANRIHYVEKEDGLYHITDSSGKDINISEDLFQFFQKSVEKSNSVLINYNSNIRSRLISRSEGFDGHYRTTDCLSWAIHYATGYSYSYVDDWIVGNVGTGGVPITQVEWVLSQFGSYSCMDINNFTTPENFANGFVIIYDTGSSLHAVNGFMQRYDGQIIVVDGQYLTGPYSVPRNSIVGIYKYY